MSEPADLPSLPATYEILSASEKSEEIWENFVGKNLSPVNRAPLRLDKKGMLLVAARKKVLARTLDRTEDVMEKSRPKIIHTRGSVVLVRLEIFDDSPFTGVLAPSSQGGGAIGLVRLSLAVPPTGSKAVTPGMGLKLFVDGKPSLDLLAMNHTVGQGRDFNIFTNPFTHDLSRTHTQLRPPQKVMQFFFSQVTSEPRRLTIDHLAEMDRYGAVVQEPKVPQRLVFRPHKSVRKLFRNTHGEDFRETLSRIPPDTTLYVVEEAFADPAKPKRETTREIGLLKTTSEFKTSEGGDRLFFRHMVDETRRLDR